MRSLLSRLAEATVVIKAAVVSDYRVAQKGARIVVGFAAKTGEVVQRAHHKLMAKQLDLIVANDVS
ncbi:phosphopantothenoylcysteine decarboxylase [Candidatus Methylomirabilis sp.]|uniref:phosphopantothenoylcysteine decarboxylase domain-containing protein n=1 Tax=Candidatus Methylomirabilis sp. TaxID=2032687 RepID=UPI003C73A423